MNMQEAPPLIEEAEVVIVGAGPAGSACAAHAAELGLDVVLIDQGSFPREKACGDGLTRSSVAFLDRLGLEDILAQSYEIEGARLVVSHGKRREKKYIERQGRPRWARCISRRVLDNALLGVAMDRGARFVKGRVDGPYIVDQHAGGVELQTDAGRARISGQIIVAADGATSRMRRKCTLGSPSYMAAAAIRQYVTTEYELDPLFEVHVPVVSDGEALFGYGWVFPLGPHFANFGIGVARAAGLTQPPSLRRLLDVFVERLRAREGARFGDIERLSDPSGSPLAIDFSSSRCQLQNILFTGDAARTVDPLTGEGISYALFAGETVADFAYGGLRKGHAIDGLGLHLARRFPRLGQDLSPVARRSVQKLSERIGEDGEAALNLDVPARQSLLRAVMRMSVTPKSDSGLDDTPIMQFLEQESTALGKTLIDLNGEMLDIVNIEFPFVSELLHRRFRAGFGPILAATLLLSNSATEGSPCDSTTNAALACELTCLAHMTLDQVSHDSQSTLGHTNAAMAILVGDFCIARSIDTATLANQSVAQLLAVVNRRMCVGRMKEIHATSNSKRTPRHYFEAATSRTGALFGLAASLGAELAGASRTTSESLEQYGQALGLAIQTASDVLNLITRDEMAGTPAGSDLHTGIYTLPVIFAVEEDTELRRLLSHYPDIAQPSEILSAIRASRGIERASRACRDRVAEAQQALVSTTKTQLTLLESLAEFVADHLDTVCDSQQPMRLLHSPVTSDDIHVHRARVSDLHEAR